MQDSETDEVIRFDSDEAIAARRIKGFFKRSRPACTVGDVMSGIHFTGDLNHLSSHGQRADLTRRTLAKLAQDSQIASANIDGKTLYARKGKVLEAAKAKNKKRGKRKRRRTRHYPNSPMVGHQKVVTT